MKKAEKIIDTAVKELNARCHQYVSQQFKIAFPFRSASISAGFMVGCHMYEWNPEIGIYGIDNLCFHINEFWYDPKNDKQVVQPMPTALEIDKFCATMSKNLGVKVFFYRHNYLPYALT